MGPAARAGPAPHRPAAARLEYELDGRPPLTVGEGDALTVPAEVVHSVRNVGDANAAELATYVVQKGKPLLNLAD